MHWATDGGHVSVVQILLASGADFDIMDNVSSAYFAYWLCYALNDLFRMAARHFRRPAS